MDFSPLIWQWSPMARWKQRDARDTHHTVSAGILDALGRGFLIATAGVVAGIMFGTVHLAAMGLGLWTIGVAAAGGIGCMIGSALIRNTGRHRIEKKAGESAHAPDVRKLEAPVPALEAAGEVAPEERRARRMVMTSRLREHGAGGGRSL